MIADRHPEIAGTIIRAVHAELEAPSVQAIVTSQRCLERDGFVCPSWEDLATGEVGAALEEEEDPNQPRAGWQSKAARKVEAQSFARLWGTLTDPQKALLRSQGGLGHHRSACPVAGVLGRRGFPLENVAARICREAGGRVRMNVFVRDLDLPEINNLDERRLEVVVDGLPLFRGAQLAIDTTLVCH